jgi:hypothetical protein
VRKTALGAGFRQSTARFRIGSTSSRGAVSQGKGPCIEYIRKRGVIPLEWEIEGDEIVSYVQIKATQQ